ncbi:hypothetical protein [Cellulomonas sp. Y8]|uniref:hypothetical protein n=1 Tax=Cellulomonas sp. Y8 TaxID=2591145 RepID=UPI0011CC4E8E|nr:hypothetical protein [Cellulomonas sp. Y8]
MIRRATDAFIRERANQRARLQGHPPFSGVLDQLVTVPPDRAGRPGYVLQTGGPSHDIRRRGPSGSRADFAVASGRRTVAVGTCIGRVPRAGSAAETAAAAVSHHVSDHGYVVLSPPTPSQFAGEPAVRVEIGVRTSDGTGYRVLSRDWHFSHRGWAFVAGWVHATSDPPECRDTAELILASWRWLTH